MHLTIKGSRTGLQKKIINKKSAYISRTMHFFLQKNEERKMIVESN